MIGKFQKHLSARAKQHDTSLWKRFFRPVMLYITLFGILWLAPSSVAVWAGISARHSEQVGADSPAFCLCVRTSPGAGDTSWPSSWCPHMSQALLSPCRTWELFFCAAHSIPLPLQRHSMCEGLKDAHPECSQGCPCRAGEGCLSPQLDALTLDYPCLSPRKANKHRNLSKEKKKPK